MIKIIPSLKQDLDVREYIILPDGADTSSVDDIRKHSEALIIRIGQYMKGQRNDMHTPPPYFLELEMNDEELYGDVDRAISASKKSRYLGDKLPEYRINGDPTAQSYATEFLIRPSRFALGDLEAFTLEIMDKLTTNNIISAVDANRLIDEEKQALPPSATEILGRK